MKHGALKNTFLHFANHPQMDELVAKSIRAAQDKKAQKKMELMLAVSETEEEWIKYDIAQAQKTIDGGKKMLKEFVTIREMQAKVAELKAQAEAESARVMEILNSGNDIVAEAA